MADGNAVGHWAADGASMDETFPRNIPHQNLDLGFSDNHLPKMKSRILLFAFGLFLIAACGGGGKFSSPESTFEELVHAIQARDLDAYTECWYPERAEREGEIGHIKEDPRTWDELVEAFKGDMKLVEEGERNDGGKTIKKFNVEAPDVADGIGTLTMIQDQGRWWMYSW